MRFSGLLSSFLAVVACAGCTVLVDDQLASKDGGPSGETCASDEQCISFDPFNCNRVCADGVCQDGPAAPDGTRCGMPGSDMICVAEVCVMRECGDGYTDRAARPPEYCDDGNDNPDDGCNEMCTRPCGPGFPSCADSNPCNGEETCGPAMFCRAGMVPAEGAACETQAGEPGTCQSGVCVE
jgi:cysteine-rich repeat protein